MVADGFAILAPGGEDGAMWSDNDGDEVADGAVDAAVEKEVDGAEIRVCLE